jgi:hypothetical protein
MLKNVVKITSLHKIVRLLFYNVLSIAESKIIRENYVR